MATVLRTGRKVHRTIYEQQGEQPSDDDPLVGVMDTPELAQAVVQAYNRPGPHRKVLPDEASSLYFETLRSLTDDPHLLAIVAKLEAERR